MTRASFPDKQARIALIDAGVGRFITAAAAALLLLALSAAAALFGPASDAGAASECASPQAANANTTTSSDGSTVYGSACADRIVVTSPKVRRVAAGAGNDVVFANPNVAVVEAGDGNDVIRGELPDGWEEDPVPIYESAEHPSGLVASASVNCEAGKSCYGGDGSQELFGSNGNDRIFGQRGNDKIYGNSGNDDLFGGVGDESLISGGIGVDLLSGGLGTDLLNGNENSDLVRGDGTIDEITDTGSTGIDTLSFASGVTPGFQGSVPLGGFPGEAAGEERGVRIHLDGTGCAGEFEACNNEARYGGGYDNVVVGGFENVIGTPFADYVVGSAGPNQIDGGGGTDVILGRGGDDALYGGPDGDFLQGDEGTDLLDGQGGDDNCAETGTSCAGSAEAVDPRDRSKISVGYMQTQLPVDMRWVQLFLTGSAKSSGATGTDRVKVAYSLVGGTGFVTFSTEGESASFDTSSDTASANCEYAAAIVKCGLPRPIDAITVAGMSGADNLTLEGFPETATPVLLGGEDGDQLTVGNGTEDLIVDGNGTFDDVLSAGTYDDALINNEGIDTLNGGKGNDLLLSASICDGSSLSSDTLQGAAPFESDGEAVNSTSWAKLPTGSVVADLAQSKAGDSWSGSAPICSNGAKAATLANIDDLEGSSGADRLYGNAGDNNLMGRLGKDEVLGRDGSDRIEVKDTPAEKDTGSGGGHSDSCVLDTLDVFSSCP